jgi:hypothetical protein
MLPRYHRGSYFRSSRPNADSDLYTHINTYPNADSDLYAITIFYANGDSFAPGDLNFSHDAYRYTTATGLLSIHPGPIPLPFLPVAVQIKLKVERCFVLEKMKPLY